MEFLLDKQNLDINLSDKILTHWTVKKTYKSKQQKLCDFC